MWESKKTPEVEGGFEDSRKPASPDVSIDDVRGTGRANVLDESNVCLRNNR